MAKGTFDKAYMEAQGQLVNEKICEITCLTNEASWVNPRKTAIFNLVAPKYKGEITSDEYEVQVTVPYNTESVVPAGGISAGDTSFTDLANIDIYEENGMVLMGDEVMVIQSVDTATGLVTIRTRGYGGTIDADHDEGTQIRTLVNIKTTCEAVGDCRLPLFGGVIKNAAQKFDACGGVFCPEDLCRKEAYACKELGTETVIGRHVQGMEDFANKVLVEKLDDTFLNGVYGQDTRADGVTAYSTRGLYSWIYGTVDSESVTHGGYVYDVDAMDACVGSAGDGSKCLNYDVLDRFFDSAGQKVAPTWTHTVVDYKTFMALKPMIVDQNGACCTQGGNALNFTQSDLYIDTPYGRVSIIVSDHAKPKTIAFFNESNIGWYSDCSVDGSVLVRDEFETPENRKLRKVTLEGYLGFDASENICDLAIIENFEICKNC